jgi:ferric-dicitrate binding protein FerR (iron transport regulator)
MENIHEIKSRYIQGTATEDELKLLLEWARKSPENKKELFNEKDIWDAYAFVRNSRGYSVARELKHFNNRIGPAQKIPFRIPNYLKIAAVFMLAFAFSWLVQSQLMNRKTSVPIAEIKTVFVPKGQINQFFLADGTRIWVNSGSTIEIPSVFTGNERTVKLSGEAFFEVEKDTEHPFKVVVEGQTIEVLGTSFNVRAYANSNKIQTTLKTGEIKLSTNKGFTTLLPGEQTELDKITGQLVLNKVKPDNFDSWKEGRYEFVNENLVEVFKVVERWYDVELIYHEADFETMNYSGVIKRNNSVQHFLTLLGHSIPIRYEIDLEKVKISKIKS